MRANPDPRVLRINPIMSQLVDRAVLEKMKERPVAEAREK